MATRVMRGMVVFRKWDERKGLIEIDQAFQSIEELFALCLQTGTTLLVDRIVIEGLDDHDSQRTLTLSFQSLTIHDKSRG